MRIDMELVNKISKKLEKRLDDPNSLTNTELLEGLDISRKIADSRKKIYRTHLTPWVGFSVLIFGFACFILGFCCKNFSLLLSIPLTLVCILIAIRMIAGIEVKDLLKYLNPKKW